MDCWNFALRERFLQNFGEQLAERRVFRRAGLLAILAVNQRDIDRLADQIQQIFSRKLDESRA